MIGLALALWLSAIERKCWKGEFAIAPGRMTSYIGHYTSLLSRAALLPGSCGASLLKPPQGRVFWVEG
jgi:hypothetical protein